MNKHLKEYMKENFRDIEKRKVFFFVLVFFGMFVNLLISIFDKEVITFERVGVILFIAVFSAILTIIISERFQDFMERIMK